MKKNIALIFMVSLAFGFGFGDSIRTNVFEVWKVKGLTETPANPDSGDYKIFANSDGKIQKIDSTGAVSSLGGGVGGTLSTVWTQDFEEVKLADFFYGNHVNIMDVAKTSLVGALSLETTTPLAAKQSIKYVQGATDSVNDFFCTPEQNIDLAFRLDKANKLTFAYTYNGANTDLEFALYDVTNSKVIGQRNFLSASEKEITYRFSNSSATEKVRLCFQVKAFNASKILVVDNLQHDSRAFDAGQTIVTQSTKDYQSTATGVTKAGNIVTFANASGTNEIIYQYDKTTGRYNFLKDAPIVNITASLSSGFATDTKILLNGLPVDGMTSTAGYTSTASFNGGVSEGDYLEIWIADTLNGGAQSFSINATAYADNVIADAASFSNTHTKYLSATHNTIGDIVPLTFTGLTIGKEYRIGGFLLMTMSGTEHNVRFMSGASNTGTLYSQTSLYHSTGSGTSRHAISDTFTATSTVMYVYHATALDIYGDGTQGQSHITLTEASPTLIQLDVSSERENIFDVEVSGAGSPTTSKMAPNYKWYTSISKTGTAIYTADISAMGLTVPPKVKVSPDNSGSGFYLAEVYNVTTSGFQYRLFDVNGSAVEVKHNVEVKRWGADYREPKAFVANAVSLINSNTSGIEYETNETMDNKKVYARSWRQGADVSGGATLVLATIETGLNPTNATNSVTKNEWWYIRIDNIGGPSVFYRYNRVNGQVTVATQSGASSYEGTIITLRYTKP